MSLFCSVLGCAFTATHIATPQVNTAQERIAVVISLCDSHAKLFPGARKLNPTVTVKPLLTGFSDDETTEPGDKK